MSVKRLAVEGCLGLSGGQSKEVEKEVVRHFALAARGLKETAQDRMVFHSFL